MAFTWSPRRSSSTPETESRSGAVTSEADGTAPWSAPVPVLLITGPAGVGKSAVAAHVSGTLERRGVGHAMIDMDALRQARPHTAHDPAGVQLGLLNLAAVWPNYRAAGCRCALVPAVVENRRDAEALAACVPGAQLLVVRLEASLITLRERLAQREQGIALSQHLQRAAELMDLYESVHPEDVLIDTEGRTADDIATEITSGWAALHALA